MVCAGGVNHRRCVIDEVLDWRFVRAPSLRMQPLDERGHCVGDHIFLIGESRATRPVLSVGAELAPDNGLRERERVLFDEDIQLAAGFCIVHGLDVAAQQWIQHVSLDPPQG